MTFRSFYRKGEGTNVRFDDRDKSYPVLWYFEVPVGLDEQQGLITSQEFEPIELNQVEEVLSYAGILSILSLDDILSIKRYFNDETPLMGREKGILFFHSFPGKCLYGFYLDTLDTDISEGISLPETIIAVNHFIDRDNRKIKLVLLDDRGNLYVEYLYKFLEYDMSKNLPEPFAENVSTLLHTTFQNNIAFIEEGKVFLIDENGLKKRDPMSEDIQEDIISADNENDFYCYLTSSGRLYVNDEIIVADRVKNFVITKGRLGTFSIIFQSYEDGIYIVRHAKENNAMEILELPMFRDYTLLPGIRRSLKSSARMGVYQN